MTTCKSEIILHTENETESLKQRTKLNKNNPTLKQHDEIP